MIRFLFKGVIRDRNRSVLPIIVVSIGVFLTVLFQSWLTGIMGESIEFNANFSTGHVKILTNGYEKNINQRPNDLALMDIKSINNDLKTNYPEIQWVERILFGGLIDVPDKNGETRVQGTTTGFGIDLFSENSDELQRLNIKKSLKKGSIPKNPGEILISKNFANKLKVGIGDKVTFIGSSMYGELSMYNFRIAGMVEFGTTILDKGAIIVDITDIRKALDMKNATSEILGFFKTGYFDQEKSEEIIATYNKINNDSTDIFSPKMLSLRDQNEMGMFVDFSSKISAIITFVFVIIMSLILWNAGLLGGLRRYGEFGVRLAIGEEKKHIYKTLIYESILVGIIGSVIGTMVALVLAYYLQEKGLDVSSFTKNATIMLPSVYKARITTETFYIGFLPGVISTVLGSMLSGIGIYKRKTAQLFKELET